MLTLQAKWPALVLWMGLGLVGCGFGEVYQPATTTTGSGGTVTTGGSGGTGGHPTGGEGGSTGGCDASTSWLVTVPTEATAMGLSADGATLVVGYSTTTEDRTYLVALDVCSGATKATATLSTGLVSNFYTKALVWTGGQLLVAGNGDYAVTTDETLILPHDPVTFAPQGAPVELQPSGGIYGADDLIWSAALGPDDALWLALDADVGAMWRYAVGSPPLRCDLTTDAGSSRGMAATPHGLVVAWNRAPPAPDPQQLAFIDLSNVVPGQCPTTPTLVSIMPATADGRSLATSGSYTFAAGLLVVQPGDNMQAGMSRYDGTNVDAMFTYPDPPADHPLIDAFVGLAADPPTAADPRVFVGGSLNAQIVGSTLTGAGFVASLPRSFNNSPALQPVMATNAKLVTVIAAAADGVFVGGPGPSGHGYVARCTRALSCPANF